MTVKVLLVAPVIAEQKLPLQSSHWVWNDIGLFVQTPLETVSVCPIVAVPVIVGAVTELGGAGVGMTAGEAARTD